MLHLRSSPQRTLGSRPQKSLLAQFWWLTSCVCCSLNVGGPQADPLVEVRVGACPIFAVDSKSLQGTQCTLSSARTFSLAPGTPRPPELTGPSLLPGTSQGLHPAQPGGRCGPQASAPDTPRRPWGPRAPSFGGSRPRTAPHVVHARNLFSICTSPSWLRSSPAPIPPNHFIISL